jgi:hypothetical protein
MLVLIPLAACSPVAVPALRAVRDPSIVVECRTEPAAADGECLGWAEDVLSTLPDARGADRLILSGPMGRFNEPVACMAEFVGPTGRPAFTIPVDCWVPSGG